MQTSPSPKPDLSSLPDPIDQLHLVMEDIETFFTAWLHRVDQLSTIETRPDQRLERMMLEFEEEKRRWELRRQREVQDIHDKAEELTRAWLRLEEEERQFLQSRESRKVAHRHDTPVPPPANRDPVEPSSDQQSGGESSHAENPFLEHATAEQQSPQQQQGERRAAGTTVIGSSSESQPEGLPRQPSIVHPAESPSLRRASPLQTSPLRESAILQFEQLRREIQTNRQQRRRV